MIKSFIHFGLVLIFILNNRIGHDKFLRPNSLIITKKYFQYSFNFSFLKTIHLGLDSFFSSLLWTNTLLSFSESTYTKKDLNSWAYLRLKTSLDLDPYFYQGYSFSGKYLSVIFNDSLGANEMFAQGLYFFPESVELSFFGAMNALLEIKDPVKTHFYLRRTIHYQNKFYWLKSLLAKLKAKQGELTAAKNLLTLAIQNEKNDSILKNKMIMNLATIQAELDINCLNKKGDQKKICPLKDYFGRLYIKNKDKEYLFPKDLLPLREKIISTQQRH
jgi:hypothetical protein